MKITTVGNAGIYMRDKKHSFLIDGLYGGNQFFNQKPSDVCEAAGGKGHLFRHIDILLFTHRHEDHFSSQYVNSYLCHNRVDRAYVPVASGRRLPYEDPGTITRLGGSVDIMAVGQKDEALFYEQIFPTVWVVFFRTRHIGTADFDIPHYSIALIVDGNSYLFMGDTDWSCPVRNIQRILRGTNLKSVFVNPLSYGDRRRKPWLAGLGHPQVLLYHIPFADDDVSGLRQAMPGETGFYHLPDGRALKENKQTVFIN